jgi:hypothetical protein
VYIYENRRLIDQMAMLEMDGRGCGVEGLARVSGSGVEW